MQEILLPCMEKAFGDTGITDPLLGDTHSPSYTAFPKSWPFISYSDHKISGMETPTLILSHCNCSLPFCLSCLCHHCLQVFQVKSVYKENQSGMVTAWVWESNYHCLKE